LYWGRVSTAVVLGGFVGSARILSSFTYLIQREEKREHFDYYEKLAINFLATTNTKGRLAS
jgi:hypothetical protein